MLKVLLVDDEPLVLVGLKSLVDWPALGYEIIATASNGKIANQMILSLGPDLVITDIKMPTWDGLKMMQESNLANAKRPAYVFLTCHDEFELARTALKMGAFDYLLKMELDQASLTKILEKFRSTRSKAQPSRLALNQPSHEAYFSKMLNQDISHDQQVSFKIQMGYTDKSYYHLVIFELVREDLVRPNARLHEHIRQMLIEILSRPFKVVALHIPEGIFPVLLEYKGEKNKRNQDVKPSIRRCKEAISRYSGKDFQVGSSQMFQDFAALEKVYKETLEAVGESKCNNEEHYVVKKVVRFLRHHYDERFTLHDMALRFDISPNYLSSIFKKEMGIGFNEYLCNTRIKAAADILLSSEMKISEVATLVGFDDAHYFSKVFKKTMGSTPSLYIANNK